MEALNFNRASKWKKNSPQRSQKHLTISLLTLLFFTLFFFSYKHISSSLLPISEIPQSVQSNLPIQCGQSKTLEEKFLWYAPHSGFSNQLSEFKNAILMSAILNRTLVVPPILDHHAVVLGSCPKFRVSDPKELRLSVWNHVVELIQSRRYVSMSDVIDLSSLVSKSAVRFIDFRKFVSLLCDIDVDFVCAKDSNMQSSLFEKLRQCGSLLSGYKGNVKHCLHALDEDCRTTVWTFGKDGEDGMLDSFQPEEQLKKKKKISFVRRRKDIYRTFGPGSDAERAVVLAFGTVFTSPYKGSESYIDIHEAPKDRRIQSLIGNVEFLPFVSEITNAGKEFARKVIKFPFLCAQLRLLDGQFKNHWKSTFLGLKQKLELLRQEGPLPMHIFVMTDLPRGNWSSTLLGELEKESDSFKLIVLQEEDELIRKTAKKLMDAAHGMKYGSSSKNLDGSGKDCGLQLLPDILLYIEETICSCASLGFAGTAGSTIAESIEMMRKHQICLS